MTSDSDDLEQQLRENLKLRSELAAKVAKAKQGGGFAYRLGWVLYWACLALAGSRVLFLAGWMAMVSGTVTEGFTQIIREPLSFLILFGIPVLALYVPDFIALRGDPSDKVPGAPGVGATGAATLLQRYGSLEAALKAGRFPAMAETLRLYRSIATMNRKAPLPSLRSQRPTWNKAAALAREWELNQLARRLKELGPLGDG